MTMMEVDIKEIANAKIGSRIKQVIILILIILIGILISITTQAQAPKHKVYRSKNECSVLAKKRNKKENLSVSVSYKKVKHKPMAEMESPASYRISARKEQENKAIKR